MIFSITRKSIAYDLYSYGESCLAKEVLHAEDDTIASGLQHFWEVQKDHRYTATAISLCMVIAFEGKIRDLKWKRRKLKNLGFEEFYKRHYGLKFWLKKDYEKIRNYEIKDMSHAKKENGHA